MNNSSSRLKIGERSPRAARSTTCNMHAPEIRAAQDEANLAESRFPRAEQEGRSSASVRAEEAYRDWSAAPPAERPIAAGRTVAASALFTVLKEYDVSRSRLADMLAIDEKTVRQWLDGSKPIPLAAIHAMPTDMATSLSEKILDARAGGSRTPKRAMASLREAVARMNFSRVSEEERAELSKLLIDVSARLNDRLRWLMGG